MSTISLGPWGGRNGVRWDDGVNSAVRQLEISHGAGIDSIRVEYDRQGIPVWSDKHGGTGGIKSDKIKLKYPDEFLTSIHGHYGSLNDGEPVLVRSLTLESNKRTFGPYGIELGAYFSLPMTRGKIVGFHGKSGWYLDAIGVYLEPLNQQISTNPMLQYSQSYIYNGNETNEKRGYSMVQGSLGKNYDLIIALRHKDDYGDSETKYFPRQSSNAREYSDSSKPFPMITGPPASSTIERIPSGSVQGAVTYGPWGGTGGTVFDDGVFDGVTQINLSRNVGIVSIKVCYVRNGQFVWGNKNGGTGGFKKEKIAFDYPSEILTHISGLYGPTMLMGPNVIQSLSFHTTKKSYGPFGEEQGQSFSTNLRDGKIVGFHGRKGLFVDAIGVHVIEGKVLPSPPLNSPLNSSNKLEGPNDEAQSSRWPFKFGIPGIREVMHPVRLVNEPSPHGSGPWGGDGGRPWDDGVFSGIKQIELTRSVEALCSIEIEYDRNGQSVWSVTHGVKWHIQHKIKLDYPNEILTCISGYYGPISKGGGNKVVKSLTFFTSRRKLGPFGEEMGTSFTSSTTNGKVVGFHGRSSMYLDAIGIHMQHWLGNQASSKPSSLMKIFS